MEKKNKINQWVARNSWLGLVLLGGITLSCGDGDNDDDDTKKKDGEKKPLKITLTAPAAIVEDLIADQVTTLGADLIIKVTEGSDNAADYKVKLGTLQCFKGNAYGGPLENTAAEMVSLLKPANDATLKDLVGVSQLNKDDELKIPVHFKAGAGDGNNDPTGLSSQITVTIVDKDGKELATPVLLKWNHT